MTVTVSAHRDMNEVNHRDLWLFVHNKMYLANLLHRVWMKGRCVLTNDDYGYVTKHDTETVFWVNLYILIILDSKHKPQIRHK